MKIAFTADLHLRSREETPDRYKALGNILSELPHLGINDLILAGDTFDDEFYNYSDFNSLCSGFSSISIKLIPGNHDCGISGKYFSAGNLEIITEPSIYKFENLPVLLMPYVSVKTMDEAVAEFFHNNPVPERWLLIGHGDYYSTTRNTNPYEPGVYMPLSSQVIDRFNPVAVILGHIHKPLETGRVIYPGSPFPVNTDETGKRRFIILDTVECQPKSVTVKNDIIYFKETLITFPVENETDLIKVSIDRMIKSWDIQAGERNIIKLKLKIEGFTNDPQELKRSVASYLEKAGIRLSETDDIDLSEVNILKGIDYDRSALFKRILEKIENLRTDTPREKIIEKVLELIFANGHKN